MREVRVGESHQCLGSSVSVGGKKERDKPKRETEKPELFCP